MRELHCDACRGERLFEVPPCVDGHGVDCPELACTDCGSALLAGFDVPVEPGYQQVGRPAPDRIMRQPLAA